MAISKAQQKAVAKYETKAYDKTLIRLPKGHLDEIRAHIEPAGESLNGFIKRAIDGQMERDGASGPQWAAGTPGGADGISLSPDVLGTAQAAAEATGEAPAAFVARAVQTQAERDKAFLKMGIDPATGKKLERTGKGGANHE